MYAGASWNDVRRLVRTGKVQLRGATQTDPAARVEPGDEIEVRMRTPRRDALPREALVYVDAEVVVADKPAGISTVPFDAKEQGTLDQQVRLALARREKRSGPPLGVVHRIDRPTSGLVVFARTLRAKRHLEQQFRAHSIHRRYLALCHGAVEGGTLNSRLVADRGDGLRGSTGNPRLGRLATTHVRVLEPLPGATLVECRLETGRTHQIRIQLSETGHPLLGERVYVRGYAGALLDAPRLMLHAAELGFVHPSRGKQLCFESALPGDMVGILESLRGRKPD